jgi:hypothetical protein
LDPIDRLASYLAGELDAAERARVAAQLDRDPALRAQLAAMERADAALAASASPEPPVGFAERLDERLAPVIDEQLSATPATDDPADAASRAGVTAPEPGPRDELAARRRRRDKLPAVWAGAAALGLLLVGGLVLSDQIGPAQEDEAAVETQTMDAGDAEERVEAPGAVDAPVVTEREEELDQDRVEELLAASEVAEIAAAELDADAGGELGADLQRQLGASAPRPGADTMDEALERGDAPETEEVPDVVPEADAAPEADAPTDDLDAGTPDASVDDAGPAVPELTTREGRTLEEETSHDVRRCLDELLLDGTEAIPAYVEVTTFEGRDALLYGLVTIDPETEAYTRAEMWVVERSSCDVLLFRQQ